jgi:hypothetical protein
MRCLIFRSFSQQVYLFGSSHTFFFFGWFWVSGKVLNKILSMAQQVFFIPASFPAFGGKRSVGGVKSNTRRETVRFSELDDYVLKRTLNEYLYAMPCQM